MGLTLDAHRFERHSWQGSTSASTYVVLKASNFPMELIKCDVGSGTVMVSYEEFPHDGELPSLSSFHQVQLRHGFLNILNVSFKTEFFLPATALSSVS